jgi:predicted ferric reductase
MSGADTVTTPVYYDPYTDGSPRLFSRPRARGIYSPLRHNLAVFFAWAIALAAIAIWVRGGGVSSIVNLFRSPSNTQVAFGTALTALAGLAGWIAALMFLYQLLLMARIPFFEFGFGRDKIVEWHRHFGFWSFWFLVAHIVLMAVGWGLRFSTNPFRQLWNILTGFPGLWLATIATLFICIAVILFSVKSIRDVLRYEWWHLLHMLAYPAVFLALPHMIWAGSTLSPNRLARNFWIILWILIALALVWYRFLLPIIRSGRHNVRVQEVIPDGSRGVTVKMTGKNLDQLGARGGSFFTWRFVDGPGSFAGLPFSLSMPPTDDKLQIAVGVVGDGTRRIAELKPGTRVIFEGPMGRINGDLRLGNRLLMFGAGAGVGPMIAILGEQDWAPGECILVTRDNFEEEAMMVPEIQELIETRGLIWHHLVGGIPTSGSTWLPPGPDGAAPDGAALIDSWLAEDPAYHGGGDYTNTDVFVCGPPIWMKAVKKDLDRVGLDPEQIHIEEFAY